MAQLERRWRRLRGWWQTLHASVLLVGAADAAHAGVNVWSSVGPYRGFVQTLAIAPSDPEIAYASVGGRVFKTTNAGATWTPAQAGFEEFRAAVLSLAVDPRDPSTAYAGNDGDGLFKTTDGGKHWAPLDAGASAQRPRALAIDPSAPDTVYAATEQGLFKSIDGGAEWVRLPIERSDNYFIAIAIAPSRAGTLYVGDTNRVFKSTDAGDTWSVTLGSDGTDIGTIAIAPSDPDTVFVGEHFAKTTDGGAIWQRNDLAPPDILAYAIDPAGTDTVYASTVVGVFVSSDGGNSWAPSSDGLTDVYVPTLAIAPQAPHTLYAGTGRDGLFKSTDGAESWRPASRGLVSDSVHALVVDPVRPDTVYAGTGGHGVFKSIDGGTSWSEAGGGAQAPFAWVWGLAIDPTRTSTVYAAVNREGVAKSTDGGATWTLMSSGLGETFINVVAIDPTNPDTLYAGSTFGSTGIGVVKSTDAAVSWTAILDNIGSEALVVDRSRTSTVYSGHGGVLRSPDGGMSWSPGRGLDDTFIVTLVIDPAEPTTLYAGSSGANAGVFKSTDGGRNWTRTSEGLTHPHVEALAIDPSDSAVLYAGSENGGVFKSSDGAASWVPLNEGLIYSHVRSLAVDPRAPGTVYAGTEGGGVFRIDQRSDAARADGDSCRIARGARPEHAWVLLFPTLLLLVSRRYSPPGASSPASGVAKRLGGCDSALADEASSTDEDHPARQLSLCILTSCRPSSGPDEPRKPNVLIVTLDTQRADRLSTTRTRRTILPSRIARSSNSAVRRRAPTARLLGGESVDGGAHGRRSALGFQHVGRPSGGTGAPS